MEVVCFLPTDTNLKVIYFRELYIVCMPDNMGLGIYNLSLQETLGDTSLVAHWMGIPPPMQRTGARPLMGSAPPATRQLILLTSAPEVHVPRACDLQQEKAPESSPPSSQLEKVYA